MLSHIETFYDDTQRNLFSLMPACQVCISEMAQVTGQRRINQRGITSAIVLPTPGWDLGQERLPYRAPYT
jgi:hypothetical protein